MELVKKIVKLRKQFSLTQKECAERAGVSLRTLRELEQGKSTVTVETANKVLHLFSKELGIANKGRSERLKSLETTEDPTKNNEALSPKVILFRRIRNSE